jgi:predicted aldo/keto reductase-like oxidoreductase
MRFPQRGGRIDEERAERQVAGAIESGVNYFDTAYVYPGSEAALGSILASSGRRDRVMVADKIPPYLVSSQADMDKILAAQLKRLRTDRIDFYLAHALGDFASWEALKAQGYPEFIARAKRSGSIRHAGFSWHGNKEEFKKVVDDFDWEFCMIQYNYLDERNQAGKEGLRYAAAKGLGLAVMEPLRGGMLSGRIPAEARSAIDASGSDRSPAALGFGWVWDQPEVSLLLSGMNEESHIEENLRLAEESRPGMLSEKDTKAIAAVREVFSRKMKVGCTGCGYCMPCPAGVDIPYVFSQYNARALFGGSIPRFEYILQARGTLTEKPFHAGLCVDCGKCEKHCPQHIAIRNELKKAHRDLDIPLMRPVIALARWYLGRRRARKAKAG